jgi:hypothetical protein
MEGPVQPQLLWHRILSWAAEETLARTLPPNTGIVLEVILYRGERLRGEVVTLLNVSERHIRRVIKRFFAPEVLTSTSTRASLKPAFPVKLALRWMSGLFPETTG